MNCKMWHDKVIEKRAGDIYGYLMLHTRDNEWTLDINDEHIGYLYNRDYVQTILEKIEYSDDDEVIRFVVKSKPIDEWEWRQWKK